MRDRSEFRLEFPRVVQIVNDIGEKLEVDVDAIEPIRVSAEFDPTATWVEFEVGAPGQGLGTEVQDRELAYERFRMQRLLFRVAAAVVQPYGKPWLFPDAVKIVQRVIDQKVAFDPGVDERELCNLRYTNRLKESIEAAIRATEDRPDALLPVLDEYEPIGSTDRLAFSTAKPCVLTSKSHISHAVCDSKLEAGIAGELEADERVLAYAKNDRLFLEIPYRHLGRSFRYRPDFIVKLGEDVTLLIEGRGKKDEKDDAKWTAARRWVAAVNAWGKLGHWEHAVCYRGTDVGAVIARVLADASRE